GEEVESPPGCWALRPEDGHPAAVPGPDGVLHAAPACDAPADRPRSLPGPVPPPLVALDQAGREETGERDADVVLVQAEQGAGDQGPDRHRSLAERGEEIQDEGLRGRTHVRLLLVRRLLMQYL